MNAATKGMGPVTTAIAWILVIVVLAAGFYFFGKIGSANITARQAGPAAPAPPAATAPGN